MITVENFSLSLLLCLFLLRDLQASYAIVVTAAVGSLTAKNFVTRIFIRVALIVAFCNL